MTILFAVVNVVVTGLFAGVVLGQYLRRHRVYQLYWSMALAMAFVGTLAYVLMVAVGPMTSSGEALFRTYYIFGAALTAAWLGLGSIALISSARITRICVAVVSLLSIVAVVLIVVGVSLISFAGGDVRIFGLEGSFWLIMAVGWMVLFAGVLLASRRATVARSAGQVQASAAKG